MVVGSVSGDMVELGELVDMGDEVSLIRDKCHNNLAAAIPDRVCRGQMARCWVYGRKSLQIGNFQETNYRQARHEVFSLRRLKTGK